MQGFNHSEPKKPKICTWHYKKCDALVLPIGIDYFKSLLASIQTLSSKDC